MNQPMVEEAKRIASCHRRVDGKTSVIMLSPHATQIRLVEITSSVADTNEVIPFYFVARPDMGMPFPFTIILLSPEEWNNIKSEKLLLPEGWEYASLKELWCVPSSSSMIACPATR